MKNNGFSLLELSIVLVIIGLIAGGIVAGSAMIRAAELRAVITEHSLFATAVNTFRDKYLGIPGDLKNATAFWGAAHATPATCLTTAGTGTQTCDGDGDGEINSTTTNGEYGEYFTFWQHLANAELINGTFTGIRGGTGSTHSVLGENIPESKTSGVGWDIATVGFLTGGSANSYEIDYGTRFHIGAIRANSGAWDPFLSPKEAWNIDSKLDDGLPAKDRIIAQYWNNLCASADDGTHANDDLEASYKLTDDSVQCSIYFIKQF